MATQKRKQGEQGQSHKLKREVSTVGLLFVSLGSIIGSGWLFGALTRRRSPAPRR